MWTSTLTCDHCQALVFWRKPAGKVPHGLKLMEPSWTSYHCKHPHNAIKCSCVLHFSSYYLSKFVLVWVFRRWRSSDTSGCPLELVGPPISTFLALLHVLPLVAAPLGVPWPLSALLSVPFPHLFTELIHCVQVGVVDELHEVSVPDLLAGRHAARHVFGLRAISIVIFMKKFFQMFCVNDFQGHLKKSLHESVLHSVTEVMTWILLPQAT